MHSTAPSQTEQSQLAPQATSPRAIPLRWALPGAVVGGVALDLAYPSVGWWPLAIPSVVVILVSLIGRTARGALLVGGVYGGTFYLRHLDWVGSFLGPTPWLALAALQTAIVAVGCVLITWTYGWGERRLRARWSRLLLLPLIVGSAWLLRETVAGAWPYTGFPWARLGVTQSNGPLLEIVSWTGVSGLTFLLVAVCAAGVQAVREWNTAGLRGAIMPTVLLGALALAPQFPTTVTGSFTVGWVQGNGPSGYFDQRAPGDILASHVDATAELADEDLDLVVWPEGSVDSDPLRNARAGRVLDEVASTVGAPVLVNAATQRAGATFNTSLLWDRTASPQVHDKRNPVPFGEYVPDRWLYEAIAPDLVGLIQREYSPGSNPPVVTVDGVRVGLAICFDVIYDRVVREGIDAGAEVLIFQTNNADFRGTDENVQQLAFARMRAVETGRAAINVSTVGTSQAIAADGSIIDALPINTTAASVTTLPLHQGITPAILLGDAIEVILATAGIVLCFVISIRARYKNPRTSERHS
ncbi:apolipoprotein N-acyltransferase [Microbacterium sp. Gd 4-13]|uniref:apolipoprotein N-acyltransferase n=1 Tax=Microbacterium sp. Gd 4-13 TaxID=2173179 RepID=UPI000D56DEA1|nr:apolipoprotein N-acyltransferase [Microbacterium sp. Gd 4-13]PVW02017.1 apolipoprotein N-acyltransferase [Microbacterium sp. Gd 4-13]